jgi:hypothetical protein
MCILSGIANACAVELSFQVGCSVASSKNNALITVQMQDCTSTLATADIASLVHAAAGCACPCADVNAVVSLLCWCRFFDFDDIAEI